MSPAKMTDKLNIHDANIHQNNAPLSHMHHNFSLQYNKELSSFKLGIAYMHGQAVEFESMSWAVHCVLET